MKSSEKLRRATKSNNGDRSWKNQNGQKKSQDEQRKAQKVQMETRLYGSLNRCTFFGSAGTV